MAGKPKVPQRAAPDKPGTAPVIPRALMVSRDEAVQNPANAGALPPGTKLVGRHQRGGRRPGGRNMSKEEMRKAIALLEMQLPIEEVAYRLGRPRSTIEGMIKRLKLKISPALVATNEDGTPTSALARVEMSEEVRKSLQPEELGLDRVPENAEECLAAMGSLSLRKEGAPAGVPQLLNNMLLAYERRQPPRVTSELKLAVDAMQRLTSLEEDRAKKRGFWDESRGAPRPDLKRGELSP